MKNYKIAIIGATGLVGISVLKVLEEKKLPIEKYSFFSSKKSAGKSITFLEKEYIVKELTENSFDEGFDFAIFAAGGDISSKYAPIAINKGCTVIDNSSYFRMHEDVPLIVPEVNFNDIFPNKGIISNPEQWVDFEGSVQKDKAMALLYKTWDKYIK